MSAREILAARREELRRRVEALPEEVQSWKSRTGSELDMNVHFSQLNAISTLMDTFVERQRAQLDRLDPAGDPDAFQTAGFELIKLIIAAQGAWDFFRDKLDLRFSPAFKEVLWVADTVAWDCYRPVLDRAVQHQIVGDAEVREPPLTYLTAVFSPATWVRGSRPKERLNDYHLGKALLPIPVIQLPWDHVRNSWEFLSLHHEVGHDIEADLWLREGLAASLSAALTEGGVEDERHAVWAGWLAEIFPDFVGLQLGGPAFAEALMNMLILPRQVVTQFNAADPHPTPYVRVLLNCGYIMSMADGWGDGDTAGKDAVRAHAGRIRDSWLELYGDLTDFTEYVEDFGMVFKALMDTPLDALRGRTVRSLVPYSAAEDGRIRAAVGYMLTGQNKPNNLPPRHCVSAARLAVTEAAGRDDLGQLLDDINDRACRLIRSNAAGGLRAGDASGRHRDFIAGFADLLVADDSGPGGPQKD